MKTKRMMIVLLPDDASAPRNPSPIMSKYTILKESQSEHISTESPLESLS